MSVLQLYYRITQFCMSQYESHQTNYIMVSLDLREQNKQTRKSKL